MRILVVLALIAAGTTGQALAQETSADVTPESADWDLVRQPEQKLTLAATVFDNGVAIAARCLDGGFDVVLAGLPAAEGRMRRLRVGLNDEPLHDESWTLTENPTVSLSDFPLNFARRLRAGGTLNIVIPGTDGAPNIRYVVNLPASSAAIDAALSACDKPLVDVRDGGPVWVPEDGAPVGIVWRSPPRPRYPGRALDRGVSYGRVVVNCVVQTEGRVGDCLIESEHPRGFGFGAEAVRASNGSRIDTPSHPDTPEAGIGRYVAFPVTFRLQ